MYKLNANQQPVDDKTVPLTAPPKDHTHHAHIKRPSAGAAGKFLWRGMRRIGEGPKILRALCLLGGVGVVAACCANLASLLNALFDPTQYVLNVAIAFFGLMVIAIELKDAFPGCGPVQRWFENWVRFLTVPFGKGLFYIFTGLLSIAQAWLIISPSAIVGGYMVLAGLICCIWHKHAERYVSDDDAEHYHRHDVECAACNAKSPK